TMDEMLMICKAVSRGAKRPLIVADMPFLSYQVSEEDAVLNAGRLVKEGRADSVKLEGGFEYVDVVKRIVRAGIPVMGHVGLTPQSAVLWGGLKLQGRQARDAYKIVEDAMALERAGVFSIVLESIPSEVAKIITESLRIPTIGIGAGPHCDGQVLVLHDLLGLFERFKPKFVKRYAELAKTIQEALEAYRDDVREGRGIRGAQEAFKREG
ncbi:MAG: 3-methyl-2-oxobutanoate hydroxymethyltransferase, partial [Nitrososphaerota archaeon]